MIRWREGTSPGSGDRDRRGDKDKDIWHDDMLSVRSQVKVPSLKGGIGDPSGTPRRCLMMTGLSVQADGTTLFPMGPGQKQRTM